MLWGFGVSSPGSGSKPSGVGLGVQDLVLSIWVYSACFSLGFAGSGLHNQMPMPKKAPEADKDSNADAHGPEA